MRTRGVIGRRITAIEQRPVQTSGGRVAECCRIILDDGTVLYPTVHETESLYYVVELCRTKAARHA